MEEKNTAKKKFNEKHPVILFIILFIVLVIIFGGGSSNKDKARSNVTAGSKTEQTEVAKDKSLVIYKDENFLVKITDYEYRPVSGSLKFSVYIENNSKTDTCFSIDGDVSVNGYMMDGGYFYETVNANSKANKEFLVTGLNKNNLKEADLKEMKFKFDVYQSKNYVIQKRIVDDKKITYKF